jgi:hypothetical protein
VILSALDDCQNNLPRASALCAQYILATLTAKTHKKISQLESWSGEQFSNYVTFIKLTILNPNMMMTSPVPYDNTGTVNPIVRFQDDWNKNYSRGTQSEQLSWDAMGVDTNVNGSTNWGA